MRSVDLGVSESGSALGAGTGGARLGGRAARGMLDSPRTSPRSSEMPRNPKYPLEALREHRDRSVEEATAQLGDAVRTRDAAEEAKRAAEAARAEAQARAAAVRTGEAELLASGSLRVADLARAEAWEHAAEAEIADLGQAVTTAEERLGAAAEAEGRTRTELARKKADLDVVEKDRARFGDRLRRADASREEEAADDVFAARRGNR